MIWVAPLSGGYHAISDGEVCRTCSDDSHTSLTDCVRSGEVKPPNGNFGPHTLEYYKYMKSRATYLNQINPEIESVQRSLNSDIPIPLPEKEKKPRRFFKTKYVHGKKEDELT